MFLDLHKKIITAFVLLLAFTQWSAAEITYSLVSGNDTWPADKRSAIISAMDEAVAFYNANGYFNKTLTVDYVPSVPTADANYSGHIRFGGQIGTRTALHEIAHTLGVGTVVAWSANIVDGNWTGPHANARLQLYNGPAVLLKCGSIHFWSSTGDSYGLNYDTQDSPLIRIRHVRMVAAFRWDMGIVTDSDFDGMPDDWETFHFDTLAYDGANDVDGDGVSNLDEYNADTDPVADAPLLVAARVVTNTPSAAGQALFDFGPASISALVGESATAPNALINSASTYIGVNSSAINADGNVNAINDADGVTGGADQERLRIAMKPGSALTGLVWNWSRADGPQSTDGVSISGFTADPGAVFSGGITGTPTYSGGTLRFQISAFAATEHTVSFTNPAASDGATLEITVADSTQAGPQLAIRSFSFTPPNVLFYSDFDSNSGANVLAGSADNTTGAAAASVSWSSQDAVTSISGLTAISTGDSGTGGGFVQLFGGTAPYANADNIFIGRNHNLDTHRSTSKRGYSLDFSVDKGFSLDKLTVRSGHATANGVDQMYTSTLVYTLSGGTLAVPVSAGVAEDYGSTPVYHDIVFDLAGTVIGAGSYTLEIYQTQMTGGGAYAIFNGIALEAINTAPIPGIGNIGALQDHPRVLAAADLLANGTDPEGDPLSIPSVSNTSTQGGTVDFSGGDITYTPPPGYVGVDDFTYTLSDDRGSGATGTVGVSVVADDAYYNQMSAGVVASNAIELGYQGIPWEAYAFEHAANLSDPVVWTPVYTNTAGSDGWLNFINFTTEPEGYFRVRVVP